MSGMLMSSRIRSGGSRRAARSASSPPGTGRTLYPRSLSMPASTWRLAGVSSTTRMPAGRPAPALAVSGFNGGPPTEQIEEGLVLEALRQAAQAPGDAGVAGFALPDRGEQPVQVRRDNRVPHGPHEVVRPARERLGGETGRLRRGGGRGVVGVVVFHPRVGVDFLEQVGVPERLAAEVLDRAGLPLLQRQVDDEHAALADLAGHRDRPAHQADELPADRQAQTSPGPRLLPGLGLLELPEQLGLVVRRNARAGVLDLDPEA